MYNFQLDTSGTVAGRALTWSDLPLTVQGAVETALEDWYDSDCIDTPAFANFCNLHPETLSRIMKDCEKFFGSRTWRDSVECAARNRRPNDFRTSKQFEDAAAGRAFWVSRNDDRSAVGFGDGGWWESSELLREARTFSKIEFYIDRTNSIRIKV
jgi:hypothetical protein